MMEDKKNESTNTNKGMKPNQATSTSQKKFKITFDEYKKLLQDLVEMYPTCFSATKPKPLKIGIRQELLTDLKHRGYSISSNKINGFMRLYCTRQEYFLSHKVGENRLDLSGSRVGEVTNEQAEEILKLISRAKTKRNKKYHKKKST